MNFPKYDAVSLDLETLGTDPGDAILAIGMVEFELKTGKQGKTFYVTFDEEEVLALGYTAKESTRKWWSNPSLDEARAKLNLSRWPVAAGLALVVEWIRQRNCEGGLWSRGYMDETMLKLMIRRELGIEDPWHYRAASDARTLLATIDRMFPFADIDAPTFNGIPHYALDDAIHEAKLVTLAHRFLASRT